MPDGGKKPASVVQVRRRAREVCFRRPARRAAPAPLRPPCRRHAPRVYRRARVVHGALSFCRPRSLAAPRRVLLVGTIPAASPRFAMPVTAESSDGTLRASEQYERRSARAHGPPQSDRACQRALRHALAERQRRAAYIDSGALRRYAFAQRTRPFHDTACPKEKRHISPRCDGARYTREVYPACPPAPEKVRQSACPSFFTMQRYGILPRPPIRAWIWLY